MWSNDAQFNAWREHCARESAVSRESEPLQRRSFNCLFAMLGHGGVTPQAVAGYRDVDLLDLDNFGRKSLQDVREWLGRYGLALKGETPAQAEQAKAPSNAPQGRYTPGDLSAYVRVGQELERLKARAKTAERLAKEAERRAEIAKHDLVAYKRTHGRQAEYWRREAERVRGGVTRELRRIRAGEQHRLPALIALENHIHETTRRAERGELGFADFRRQISLNFAEYRKKAGLVEPSEDGDDEMPVHRLRLV
jgi:hypothetical protein